jgi:hypothetical protein
MVEDTHSSYWYEYHRGLREKGSFVEYCKSLIDSLYVHHINANEKLIHTKLISHISGISFYDSVVVFDKKYRDMPYHSRKGVETIVTYVPTEHKKDNTLRKVFGKFRKGRDSVRLNDKGKI